MKKIISILLFACSVQMLSAQVIPVSQLASVDSLKHELQTTSNDTIRLVLVNQIQNHYFLINTNLDSALFYSRQLLELAQKLNYRIDEAYAYDLVGSYMNFLLNAQTLVTYFKGIRIVEDAASEKNILPEKYLERMIYWDPNFNGILSKKHWSPNFFRMQILASLYGDLGGAYGNMMSNQQRLFFYSFKAIDIYKFHNDKGDLAITYNNISNYFASINQYDSCLYFARKSYDLQSEPGYITTSNLALIELWILKKVIIQRLLNFSENRLK